jgi:ABC-type lipopolysaccharide export system ATPase subunit
MKHTLEVDSVILEFGDKRVLQDVYLKCETGKVTGLLGRNGTGKSCLMNIIYGKLSPTNKSIRLDGKVMLSGFNKPETFRYLPQFHFIPKSLSIKRIFRDFKLDFSKFALLFPTIEKYYNTHLGKLSGGERRIIEIYAILASDTMFCMLDEPFSQVMPVHVDTIKSIIDREKQNKGIFITDHLYRHIIDACDDLYLIKDGKTHLIGGVVDLERLGYVLNTSDG